MIKYNRIMEKVNPSPEMEERLHSALDAQTAHPHSRKKNRAWIKTAGTLAACLVLVLGGTALFRQQAELSPEPGVATPSGMQDFDSVEALASSLTFPLALPDSLPEGYEFSAAANQFGMAVVIYSNGTDDIRYYMSEDDSAVDGAYHTDEGIQIEAGNATLFADGAEENYTAAEWQDENYSYSVLSSAPLTESEFAAIIQSVSTP